MASLDMGLVRGILSVIVFAAFVGVVLWAWSGRRKRDFEEASRLPLDENKQTDDISRETRHD